MRKDKPEDLLREVGQDEAVKRLLKVVVGLIGGVIGLYLLHFIFILPFFSGDPAHWGAFGDYFAGVVNPILTALTLFLVAATVYYTKKLLDATREELQETHKGMAQQNFDSRAFFLLKTFQEVRDRIHIVVQPIPIPAAFQQEPEQAQEYRGSAAIAYEFSNVVQPFIHEGDAQMTMDRLKQHIEALETRFMTGTNAKQYISCLLVVLRSFRDMDNAKFEFSGIDQYRELLGALIEESEAVLIYLYSRSSLSTPADAQLLHNVLVDFVMDKLDAYTYGAITYYMDLVDAERN